MINGPVSLTRAEFNEGLTVLTKTASMNLGFEWLAAFFVAFGIGRIGSDVLGAIFHCTGTLDACSLLSNLMYFVFPALIIRRFLARRTNTGVTPSESKTRAMSLAVRILLCVAIIAAWLLAAVFIPPEPPAPASSTQPAHLPTVLFIGLLPWIITFLGVWVFLLQVLRRSSQLAWERSSHSREPQTVTATADGLLFENRCSHRRFSWRSFVGWHETASMFVLYHSANLAELICKRGFVSPMELDQFRGMLVVHITPWQPPPIPVVTAASTNQPHSTAV